MATASEVFAKARDEGRMTFMPFITAGDPDLNTTAAVLTALSDSGVDLIELGFPYSDPVADGPVIQASYTRALNAGVSSDGILDMLKQLPTDSMAPIFGMVSYAIVFRYGVDRFLDRCADSGMSGLIVPDLPAEEALEFSAQAAERQLDVVQLVAPTTSHDRAAAILQAARGFVYCISVAGTTGVRNELPAELTTQLQELRQQTPLPLAVGFGISSPDQVGVLGGVADGVIVGSAIVRKIANASSPEAAVAAVRQFADEMNTAVGAVAPSTVS